MGALNDDSGPVDQLLDEMFDRLAGTGAAGRRLLAEAEDHLRTATAQGIEQGLSTLDAEREAVARFGPVADSVPAPARAFQVIRVTLFGWTLLALGAISVGAAALFDRVFSFAFVRVLAADGSFGVVNLDGPCTTPDRSPPLQACAEPPAGVLSGHVAVPMPTVTVAWVLVVAGLVMLGPPLLAHRTRHPALFPSRRALSVAVSTLFTPVGVGLIAFGAFQLIANTYALDAGAPAGRWAPISVNLSTGLLALSVAALAGLLRGRRPHPRAAERPDRGKVPSPVADDRPRSGFAAQT